MGISIHILFLNKVENGYIKVYSPKLKELNECLKRKKIFKNFKYSVAPRPHMSLQPNFNSIDLLILNWQAFKFCK